MNALNAEVLSAWARELGFCKMGVCSPADFAAERQAVESQPPIPERKQLRFEPTQDHPATTALLVLLWPYRQAKKQQDSLFVDSYYAASNAAYHAARAMEQKLMDAGCFARANVSYPAREAAVRAGLGLIGRNGLLITPEYGTRTVIILIATDAISASETSENVQRQDCLACGKCAGACPAGAIHADGTRTPQRCLRNTMCEGVVIPEEQRMQMGNRLLGCDTCQRVCPMQNAEEPEEECPVHRLSGFVTADDHAFSEAVSRLAGQVGRNMARPQRVRAQAAVLAGVSGNPAYLPVLEAWAESAFEAVSTHAKWAMEQIKNKAENGQN